jgi:putative nucleotidyltransferase with HDIG domain
VSQTPAAAINEPPSFAVPGSDIVEPLAVRIERDIREGRVALPVLPRIALQVQQLIEEGASTSAIVEAIEREPSIAAALVRYANSVAYAGLRDVTDLHQAVLRMGHRPVQQTVLALSARSVFDAGDKQYVGLYRVIWTHSVATALAARRLASRASVPPETAFLAGLLHDIGKVVILQCASELRRREVPGFAMDEPTLREFLDALHCRAGDILCEAWNIPADLRDVVLRHHDASLTGPKDLLTAVVQAANLMATKIGISLHPDPQLSLLDKPASLLLRLDDVRLANLLVDLEDDTAKIEGLF